MIGKLFGGTSRLGSTLHGYVYPESFGSSHDIFGTTCRRHLNWTYHHPLTSPLSLSDGVRDKNFYLYHVLASSVIFDVFRLDPTLQQLTDAYRSRLRDAENSCGTRAACYVDAARLTDAEIGSEARALSDLYVKSKTVRGVVEELRQSGTMIESQNESDQELLSNTWRASAASVNRILATYADGVVTPLAGEIDAMTQDPHSESFGALLRTVIRVVTADDVRNALFISDPTEIATLVLGINGHDEAGRFEPLERGENLAAITAAKQTKWLNYRYPIILVPGDGPDDPGVHLSARGRLRLELAINLYRKGTAPFILVSGGYVHPPRTPYCEALEMKRSLIEHYHVPPDAILIDPHARHTTTNIRNAARILYRYGMPFSSPSLIVTDENQTSGIMSDAFDARNLREIGELPYISKKQISPFEVEFVPSVNALQVNWLDPLDP